MTSKAASILTEAATIVDGARQQTHGDRERSFAVIAKLWTTYCTASMLKHESALHGVGFTAHDVAMMMALLKVARSACGTPTKDHFVDLAGYAALAGELAGVE